MLASNIDVVFLTVPLDRKVSAKRIEREQLADSVRARLLTQFKEAKVVDEFSGSVESMSGPAFEVEWRSDAGMKMTTRVAFVPHPGGHIEFVVQAPSTEIRKYDQSLNQLLLSIRSSPVGEKLAVQEFLSEQ